jgi:predicted DNA-binding ribbon-helix-helix protein
VRNFRTSIKLESALWTAAEELCAREKITIDALCDMAQRTVSEGTRTSRVRVYLILYWMGLLTRR